MATGLAVTDLLRTGLGSGDVSVRCQFQDLPLPSQPTPHSQRACTQQLSSQTSKHSFLVSIQTSKHRSNHPTIH